MTTDENNRIRIANLFPGACIIGEYDPFNGFDVLAADHDFQPMDCLAIVRVQQVRQDGTLTSPFDLAQQCNDEYVLFIYYPDRSGHPVTTGIYLNEGYDQMENDCPETAYLREDDAFSLRCLIERERENGTICAFDVDSQPYKPLKADYTRPREVTQMTAARAKDTYEYTRVKNTVPGVWPLYDTWIEVIIPANQLAWHGILSSKHRHDGGYAYDVRSQYVDTGDREGRVTELVLPGGLSIPLSLRQHPPDGTKQRMIKHLAVLTNDKPIQYEQKPEPENGRWRTDFPINARVFRGNESN
jgi:hypothetical protein